MLCRHRLQANGDGRVPTTMAVKWNPFLTLRRWNWFGRFATDAGSDETTRVSRVELDALETRQRLTPDVSTKLFAHNARGILQVVVDCEKERGQGQSGREQSCRASVTFWRGRAIRGSKVEAHLDSLALQSTW